MKDKLMIFENVDFKKTLNILMLIVVIGGIVGFIYEELFYRIDLGYFVKRGSSYGPWVPIYAFGSLAITLLLYRFKKSPIKVFLLGTILTGIIEYSVGAILYYAFNLRLWDYNVEIWNFGNINGFICLRSVLLFGAASVLLIYGIVPNLIKLMNKAEEKVMTFISIGLFSIFIIDIICYQLINNIIK